MLCGELMKYIFAIGAQTRNIHKQMNFTFIVGLAADRQQKVSQVHIAVQTEKQRYILHLETSCLMILYTWSLSSGQLRATRRIKRFSTEAPRKQLV
jgi:hypothetical protein